MRDFPKFFQHIKALGYSPDICIDVGAGYGTGSIYSAFPDAHHILFEPLESNRQQLEQRLAGLSHEIHFCGLMAESGTMELDVFGKDNLGSTLMNRSDSNKGETIHVPIYRLDEFKQSIPAGSKVLLKTDCQGADLDVLKGATNILKQTDIVLVEASLYSFWGSHHPTLKEIINFMSTRGFEVYDFLELAYRPLDNALGQVDVVFAKSDGEFRKSRAWGRKNNTHTEIVDDTIISSDLKILLDQKNAEISHLKALNNKSKNKDKLISHLRNLIKNDAKEESILFELKRGLKSF